MEYTLNQIIAFGAALTMFALAACFMYSDAASRVTEAVLDAIEIRLARRAERSRRAGGEIHVTVFNHR